MTVEVRDPSLPASTSDSDSLAISVSNVNEAPTVTLQNPVTGLAEDTDTTSRTKVADIIITDDALGTNSLSLAGSDASLFTIDGNELFLNAGVSLDISANPSLDVVVQVRDLSLPAATQSTASLSITIADVNDPPSVTLANQTVSLAEDFDTSTATKVADIVVSDDATGTNDLSLSGPDAGLFTIVGNELFLRAGVTLDHETNPNLDVTVEVRDPSLPASTSDSDSLAISVSNVNEAPTVTLQNPVTGLAENTDTTSRTKVADIVVTDDALGTNTLTLSGADAGLFSIVGSELFLNSGVSLDFDANPSLDVRVTVRDTSLPSVTQDFADLSIALSDVNSPPSISLDNVVTGLSENADTSSRIKLADIVITDDGTGTHVLTLSGADQGLLEIVGTELFLRAGVALDAATNPTLTATIEIQDPSLAAATKQMANLSVAISAVNDPPAVALQNQRSSLAEDADTSSRTKVADIVITDDAQGTADLSLSGLDSSSFEIVGAELFLRAGVALDFEGKDQFDVQVQVRDPSLAASTTDTANYSLSISDVNEAPSLSILPSLTSLPESTSVSSDLKVADLFVTDDALGTNQLQLSGTNANRFTVVGSELFLKAGTTFDFETEPSIQVQVQVIDSTLPTSLAAPETYALSITNTNDAPTVSLINAVSELNEDVDTSARIKVADITIDDDALGKNSLSLSGPNAGQFEIVGTELYLSAGTILNFETLTKLQVSVDVTDVTLSTSPSDSVDYAFAIRNVVEAPTLQLVNTVTSLPEDHDTSAATRLADIDLTDDDGNHSYTLAGTDAGSFEIQGNSLFLRQGVVLNFDAQDTYQVTIQVDDDQIVGTVNASVDFQLAISDVNLGPTITLNGIVTDIDENSDNSAPIHVADIRVTDDATGTNILGLSGPDASVFNIVGTKLFLNAGTVLDAETADSFRVRVNVADSSTGEMDFARFQLLVNDINEAPVFSTSVSNIVLKEDTTLTLDVTGWVSDEDANDQVRVELVAPNWIGAELDRSSRELRFTPNADANGTAQISLIATDNAGATVTTTLPVEVVAVNDTIQLSDKVFVQSDSEKITGNLLPSKTDADGEPLEVQLVTAPKTGSLELLPDGSFTFVGDGSADTVEFQVLVNDGISPSNLATIEIQPIAPAPTITNNTAPPEPIESPTQSTPTPTPAGPIDNDDEEETLRGPRQDVEKQSKNTRGRTAPLLDSEEPTSSFGQTLDTSRNQGRPQSNWVVLRQQATGEDSILLSLEADRKGIISEATVMLRSTELWKELDSIRQTVNPTSGLNSLALGTVSTATSSFLVGYLFWTIRSGLLLSSVMAALPTWQMFDPLAIVANGDEEDGESLQDIVDSSTPHENKDD